MALSDAPRAGAQIPELIHTLARATVEERAQLVDREMYDQLLVQMLLRYASAERELRELNELKNRFLGMAAHDLRNPLTAIRGFSQILLEMKLDGAKQTEFLKSIHRSSDDMLRLVNDLLDVAVIESGKLDLRLRDADLSELVNGRIKLVAPVAEKKQIGITTTVPEAIHAVLDPDRFAQVIDNLLTNAIKFSPPGSGIQVGIRETADAVILAVRDSGPGIAAEDREKLFGTFQKLAARPTGGEKSTGLGLAIVKKIVDAHRGGIDVVNVPGSGAEFSVRLPRGSPP